MLQHRGEARPSEQLGAKSESKRGRISAESSQDELMNDFHREIRTIFSKEITHNEQFDQLQPEERKRGRINSPSLKGKAINTAVS